MAGEYGVHISKVKGKYCRYISKQLYVISTDQMQLLVDIYQMPLHTEAPTQVGAASWKSGHFSICGATVRSRGGYSSMYRGEDLQPVGDHQGHHPWVLSSNFYDQPRTLERGLYAHLLRNGTHAQYGDQAKSRRRNNSTFHYLPGPFQLHGHFSQQDAFFIIILYARCIFTTRTISWLTQIHTAYQALIESRICKCKGDRNHNVAHQVVPLEDVKPLLSASSQHPRRTQH